MANGDREFVHVVANEPNQTEARDGARELNVIQLLFQLLLWRSIEHLFRVVVNKPVLSFLSPLSEIY